MDCTTCESVLPAYASDDLPESEATACREHLDACASCRRSFEVYSALIGAIVNEPPLTVSASESAALAMALSKATCAAPVARETEQWRNGVPALLLASLAAFVLVAAVLAAQTLGLLSLHSLVSSLGRVTIALMTVIIVFVTSFIPIAVTARRRPLNGMTFRG